MSALELVLECLERGQRKRVRRQGGSWYACCPAHDDRSPSLKIDVGEDGRVLLSCKVGCRNQDIVSELGLEMRDLFERENAVFPPRQVRKKPRQRSSESSRRSLEEIHEEYFGTELLPPAFKDWLWGYEKTLSCWQELGL